jgi:hypothetical protein
VEAVPATQPTRHVGAAPANDGRAYEPCSPPAAAVAANEDGVSTAGEQQGRHWHYVPPCRGARHNTILEMVGLC